MTLSTKLEHCRHGFRKSSWLACPSCRPEDAAVLSGAPSTPEQRAAVAVKGQAMRSAVNELDVRNPRTLALEGQTLAGCLVGTMAANAGRGSRFHSRASCGHDVIFGGAELKRAHKEGTVLRCKPCTKAFHSSERAKKREAKKRELQDAAD